MWLHGSKQILKLVACSVVFVGLFFMSTPRNAYAHQSGCHRWHSCPSDSGSYTCGDLGYTSGCGGTTYQPSRYSQGLSNGEKDANSIHKEYIINKAKSAGYVAGYDAAYANAIYNSVADTVKGCEFTITFSTQPDDQYLLGYKSSWISACTPLYSNEYAASYKTGFSSGAATLAANTSAAAQDIGADTENVSDEGAGSWSWLVGGAFVISCLWAVIFMSKKD